MNYIALITLSLFLYSCQNHNSKPQLAEAAPVQKQEIDTLHYKDQVVNLEPIDSSEFFSLPAAPGIRIDSMARIKIDLMERIDDTANVYRNDTILVLKFDNGDSVQLVSRSGSETEPIYTYLCEIKQLNSYYIKSREPIFDGSNFFVWNKAKGIETRVFGFPLESPNGKTAICYNFCFASDGASENGFQIFSLDKDHTLHLKWTEQADPSYWGPAECRWKDNQTIYIKVKHISSKGMQTKYEKLVLPNFTK
jgi:hypothetical protein